MGTFAISVEMVVEANNIEEAYQMCNDVVAFIESDFTPETGYVETVLPGNVEADDANI